MLLGRQLCCAIDRQPPSSVPASPAALPRRCSSPTGAAYDAPAKGQKQGDMFSANPAFAEEEGGAALPEPEAGKRSAKVGGSSGCCVQCCGERRNLCPSSVPPPPASAAAAVNLRLQGAEPCLASRLQRRAARPAPLAAETHHHPAANPAARNPPLTPRLPLI